MSESPTTVAYTKYHKQDKEKIGKFEVLEVNGATEKIELTSQRKKSKENFIFVTIEFDNMKDNKDWKSTRLIAETSQLISQHVSRKHTIGMG